jgi:hypothetical protein
MERKQVAVASCIVIAAVCGPVRAAGVPQPVAPGEEFAASLDARVFQAGGYGAWPEALGPIFDQAAKTYNVPRELLLALGKIGSAFENRGDQPTIEYGYGVMALRNNPWGGESLLTAAQLLHVSADTIKSDPRLNIMGAAAVLDAYANEAKLDRTAGLDMWLGPLIRYSGLQSPYDRLFAQEVFERLQGGLDATNTWGETFAFAAQPVTIDLESLSPPPEPGVSSPDYGPATWDPAPICNYSTANNIGDTVIIHTVEGSYAGCISWFKNCTAQVTSQYVVSEGGAITQMVRENQQAWHVSCYNYRAIGLEHEGYAASPSHPLAQYDASADLVKDICNRHGIPKSHNAVGPGILGHIDVTNCCCGTHTDPGNGWDWSYFISRVNGAVAQPSGPWTHSSGEFNPTQTTGSWTAFTDCDSVTSWWATVSTGSELFANWDIKRLNWNFRGRFRFDAWIPCTNATKGTRYRFQRYDYNPSAANPDNNRVFTEGCDQNLFSRWVRVSERDWGNDRPGGVNVGTYDVYYNGSSYTQMGISKVRWYGHKWEYINDWTCLGGYSSSAVSDSHGLPESGLYLYPAVDATHGNVFAYSGKTPGHVQTGDCNWANSLDFKGNAHAYGGGDNMDSYGFCWVYAPAGAGPKFLIGSDDGNRVWVNGSLINDNNSARGLTRDQDETSGIGLPTGWSRVLFKIHNGTGSFQGTVSLRNGTYRSYNEPSVTLYDLGGGVKTFGLGYEQDDWYPRIDVASFYGAGDPQPNSNYYGNNSTVTAGGTASVTGPVPLWKVMHFEWGYGLSGDTNYTDVSSTGATWSHTATGVTGHRRFHFFSVSQSRRTSFQNSGVSGGWNWADGGAGNYMDVYVDNVPPQNPGFASVTVAGTSRVDLAWSIPLDQGVGTDPGADEAADETNSAGGNYNYYRRGDVGVSVRRNGTSIYDWSTDTSASDDALSPNIACTYEIAARDNNSGGRGAWNNQTGWVGSTTVWTLSAPPADGSVTPNPSSAVAGNTVSWTAVGGFGAGTIAKYKYAFDTNATHTWDGSEADWSGGDLATVPDSAGTWYLHVQGYNGAGAANGTYDYALTVAASPFAAADFDRDGDVDLTDFSYFQMCFNGPNRPAAQPGCVFADLDDDNDVDLTDFAVFQGCFNGPNRPAACRP